MDTKQKIISRQVEYKIAESSDVVVAGGGTAGVIAAIAAARAGAKVTLVERYGYLGGMITAGNAGLTMYTKFSGNPQYHAVDQEALKKTPGEVQLVGGLVREFTERLLQTGVGIGNYGTYASYVFTSSEDAKRLLFQMMKESKVRLKLHTLVTGVVRDGDMIKGITVESKSGPEMLPASQFIDATGDGDVAARAGVPFTIGVTEQDICANQSKIGQMQNVGVMFKVGNVDLAKTMKWLKETPERFNVHPFARFPLDTVRENFERGETCTMCIRYEEQDGWFQVYNLPTKGVVTLCCPQIKDIDGLNSDDLSRAELLMSEMVERWVERIKSTTPGFENMFLLDCPQMGVRETRHIQGDYLLNLMDIYEQRDFEDCIGFGSHPIDTRPRPEWIDDPEKAYPPRWFFQIPFRSLVAKDTENLLMAGRCISATHEAFGCIRPTVQCMITGEAAGIASAIAARDSITPREIPTAKLREELLEYGVMCDADALENEEANEASIV